MGADMQELSAVFRKGAATPGQGGVVTTSVSKLTTLKYADGGSLLADCRRMNGFIVIMCGVATPRSAPSARA